jgi:hypothetical protein
MLRACCVAKSTWIGLIEPIEFTQPFCGRFIQNTRALPYDKIPQKVDLYVETGWGGRIRTSVWRNQNPDFSPAIRRHEPHVGTIILLSLDLSLPESDIYRRDYDPRCRHGADMVARGALDAGKDHQAGCRRC